MRNHCSESPMTEESVKVKNFKGLQKFLENFKIRLSRDATSMLASAPLCLLQVQE